MKKNVLILLLALCLASPAAFSQLRLNAAIDVLKTDFFNEYPTLNLGVELAYFASRSVALTGGVETWDKPDMNFGVALGARWYPINPLFIRGRGILSNNSDFNLGLGYAFPLSQKWRLEVISDYYAVRGDFALRAGLGFRL